MKAPGVGWLIHALAGGVSIGRKFLVYTGKMKNPRTKCDLCDRLFLFGPGRYKGKYIQRYEMTLCNSCFKVNWDGFGPGLEDQFIAHMKRKSIALPERNKQGWFPR